MSLLKVPGNANFKGLSLIKSISSVRRFDAIRAYPYASSMRSKVPNRLGSGLEFLPTRDGCANTDKPVRQYRLKADIRNRHRNCGSLLSNGGHNERYHNSIHCMRRVQEIREPPRGSVHGRI